MREISELKQRLEKQDDPEELQKRLLLEMKSKGNKHVTQNDIEERKHQLHDISLNLDYEQNLRLNLQDRIDEKNLIIANKQI